ncbi:3'(2'),5'-bisphosphate nucleotidase CysQ [Nocardia tengchongensis]|uniref:3'(2'),5'-bisphosphate nucleotidase CysQ n=1 Tax=Nocardia tengchongensis TaxID=2055889 RepID=UPI0036B54190
MTADSGLAAELASRAGALLLELRASGGTGAQGDSQSNRFLIEELSRARPGDAILSEESADDPRRLTADRVWIIDPLDGTREFAMPDRSDWAVHVALWERGHEITAAAVALPALGTVYSTSDLVLVPQTQTERSILVSASRPPACASQVASAFGAKLATMGSAGAKTMAVVRGEADAYLHAGGQYEWDSAAPAGVALAAGLHASRLDGCPLRYNQADPYLPDLLICRTENSAALLAAIAAASPVNAIRPPHG